MKEKAWSNPSQAIETANDTFLDGKNTTLDRTQQRGPDGEDVKFSIVDEHDRSSTFDDLKLSFQDSRIPNDVEQRGSPQLSLSTAETVGLVATLSGAAVSLSQCD